MNIEKFKKLEDVIKPILEESEESRNDDFYLYSEVLWRLHPEALSMSVATFLRRRNESKLPSYESVTRTRRKLQAEYPELASDRTVRQRKKEEAVYREYAKTS